MPQRQLLTPLILHAIKYFDSAARHRSFTRAAEELHVTQGAVSQQIKGLEEQIGVMLFKRLPRGLALTQEGERLYRVAQKVLRDLEAELHAIQPVAPNKTLLIRASPSFSMMWLMPRLNSFSRLYPEISIRLRGELFGMSNAIMNQEAIDLLIMYGKLPQQSDQQVTVLMNEYLIPVASADYLQQHASILTATDFASHRLLHDDSPWEGAPAYEEWTSWLRALTKSSDEETDDLGRHGNQFNLSQLAVNAALQGQGLAMARVSLVMDELNRKQLVPVIAQPVLSAAHYFLVINHSTSNRDAVKLFKEWIIEECQTFELERDNFLRQLTDGS
ncbi:LysR substrate-binding domain-containing protein [Undibacterium sp. TJN19]|uniref:LysR substrate-binding domain-containing protein n=1 Tax=Undibacterium sp. TJN19 TaxID=3413055 RepID=UPI003BF27E25